jgi:hypothetical protein
METRSPELGAQTSSVLILYGAVAALAAGLLVFSQTAAYSADEGFHLVAAQLVRAGRRLYLDFFYQHPPLYPYVVAAWMRAFGESWRSAHVLSALLTSGCVFLVAEFVFGRLGDPDWRLAGGLVAAVLVGLQSLVIQFGTIAQPYGLSLFLAFLSARLATAAVDRERGYLPFWAGLCSGGAAAVSLLAAPVATILLLWMARQNRAGDRRKKCIWSLAGAAIPFLPLLWLAARAPRQTVFDIFTYHLFYRGIGYPRAWNLRIWGQWMDSAQILLPALLAGMGLLFAAQEHAWEARRRAEVYLCAWLAAGLGVWVALVRPTFPQYFVLLVPFLSVPAAVGVRALAEKIGPAAHPLWPAAGVATLFALGLGKWAYESRPDSGFQWKYYEDIASVVNRVAPPDVPVFSTEDCIYFAARRLPPAGLENPDFRLPAGLAAKARMEPVSGLEASVAAGRFGAVAIWSGDGWVNSLALPSRYARYETVHGYEIFWDRIAGRRDVTEAR